MIRTFIVLLLLISISEKLFAQDKTEDKNDAITKDALNYFDVYAHVISNSHTNLQTGKIIQGVDVNSESVIRTYVEDCKGINLRVYDEFETQKLISKYKDSLTHDLDALDINKNYTNVIFIDHLGEYDFKNKVLLLEVNNDLSLINFGATADNGLAKCAVFFTNVPEKERQVSLNIDENEAEYLVKKFKGNRDSILIMVEQFRLSGAVLDRNYRSFVASKIEKGTFYVCHYYTPPYSSYSERARDEAAQMRPGYISRRQLVVDRPLFEIEWPDKKYPHLNLF